MIFKKKSGSEMIERDERTELVEGKAQDALLEQALGNFRSSVHAWSEAELSRPRKVVALVRRGSLRLAAGWALGFALVAGSVSGGLYERHYQQEKAGIAAARQAEQPQSVAEQRADVAEKSSAKVERNVSRESPGEEELLAKVDSDISRQVPSALEPLAQLMVEDEAR
jgi:hypothetical protein